MANETIFAIIIAASLSWALFDCWFTLLIINALIVIGMITAKKITIMICSAIFNLRLLKNFAIFSNLLAGDNLFITSAFCYYRSPFWTSYIFDFIFFLTFWRETICLLLACSVVTGLPFEQATNEFGSVLLITLQMESVCIQHLSLCVNT